MTRILVDCQEHCWTDRSFKTMIINWIMEYLELWWMVIWRTLPPPYTLRNSLNYLWIQDLKRN